MNITIVAGARPNFMKIAPIINAIEKRILENEKISYRLVHTGQHYDNALSHTFFKELGIPDPHANLGVRSGSQSTQTANIMIRFEEELINNPTDVVMVVGDVNSTMACGIVAKKLNTQLVHVEAGIRSFDLTMPEEINRMVTDSITDQFFTTSEYANNNLKRSGVDASKIHFVGNTMIDTLYANLPRLRKPSFWNDIGLKEKHYIVLTLHRPSNVDDMQVLQELIAYIDESSGGLPIIFPAHPRTANNLKKLSVATKNIITIEPMGYLEFIYLIKNSKAVVTDSGGIQEETTILNVPCLTMRKNSERPETISVGTNELIYDVNDLQLKLQKALDGKWKQGAIPDLWDGKAAERIASRLLEIYK